MSEQVTAILTLAPHGRLVVALGAALAYAVLALVSAHLEHRAVRGVLLLAWVLHVWTLAMGLLGESPRFGFAPALSMTAWLTVTVYAVESRWFTQLRAHWALAGLASSAVVLSLIFPGTSSHLFPSPWLALHLALGLASYGLFAAAVIHGWLMMRTERAMRLAAKANEGLPLLTLERLTFRFVQAGFVLLSATLLGGWWFAEQLYGPGRAWQWSHKTVFSVLAWLTFAGLLVGRARLGWRGRKAVRVLYVGSGLLLLAYVGSRFVLEVVLLR